jgi:hypothetical protein
MPAFFQEVFSSAGVDEEAMPLPGAIVSSGGSNFVRLIGGKGLHVDPPRGLKVEEIGLDKLIQTAHSLPAFHTLLVTARKSGGSSDTRHFQISPIAPHGSLRTQLKAVARGHPKQQAVLDVAVLPPRPVKLSIRPVQIRDPQGNLVFHSKKPFDTAAMVDQMNSIWTLQANVVFELVSSNPAPVTDEGEIAKILDLKSDKAPLPPFVALPTFTPVFDRLKDPNAELTMFLVEKAGDLGKPGTPYRNATTVSGITDPKLGISLISDERTFLPELMAHEAGHRIGSTVGKDGKFLKFGHTGGPRDLMHDGGRAEAKVPFKDVIGFFNRP